MPAVQETIDQVRQIDVDQYKYGFETLIEMDKAPKGLNEDIIRFISAKKEEPEWMLEWRLEAYRRWLTMEEPSWARVEYPKIDFNDLYYYASPRRTRPGRRPSTRSIRSCWRPTRSSAFRFANRKCLPASQRVEGRRGRGF